MAEQDISPPTITAMKIPIIRKGEYSIWSKYICHIDHNLWDVIVHGDLEEEPAPTGETSAPPAPKTAKQLAARRNQERVKSIDMCTDKSKITRKQSKTGKHGHENQKSSKPKPEKSNLSQIQCPQSDLTAQNLAPMIDGLDGRD
ncbi:hypothetical protein Tco_0123007 [Tanacetum coccineum]